MRKLLLGATGVARLTLLLAVVGGVVLASGEDPATSNVVPVQVSNDADTVSTELDAVTNEAQDEIAVEIVQPQGQGQGPGGGDTQGLSDEERRMRMITTGGKNLVDELIRRLEMWAGQTDSLSQVLHAFGPFLSRGAGRGPGAFDALLVKSEPPHPDREKDGGETQQDAGFWQNARQAVASHQHVLKALHGPEVGGELGYCL
jgi:hypothetical protein